MNYNPYAMSYYKKPVKGELTGKRRFRKKIQRIDMSGNPIRIELVLQVEESIWNDVQEGREGRWVCEWRDATPEDVTEEVV